MPQPLPSPHVPEGYSPLDWTKDLCEFQRLAQGSETPEARKRLAEFLYRKYPDDPFAEWKGDRLLAAYLWVIRHCRELDVPDVAVVGSSEMSITCHLAVALYRFWTAVPDEKLGCDPEAGRIISLAQEQARINRLQT